jgi:hypothetical protein
MGLREHQRIKRCIEVLTAEIRHLECFLDQGAGRQTIHDASKRVVLAAAQLDELMRSADNPENLRGSE